MSLAITRVTIVTPEAVIPNGVLRIEDGCIAGIGEETAGARECLDGGGQLLIPGAIDVHGDALEKIIEPRPGVHIPVGHIMPQADRLYAAAGVTTAWHAITCSETEMGIRNLAMARRVGELIHAWSAHGAIDHRLHCRYEIGDPAGFALVADLLVRGIAGMLSVMDHSPGQGQFRSTDSFVAYFTKTFRHSVEDAMAIAERKSAGREAAWQKAAELMSLAKTCDIPVASHDDDHPDRVAVMRDWGATICEFPVDLATARAAHASEICTLFGAPNVVRGGSQSGNMKAIDAIRDGCCGALVSDYVPWTLVPAALSLPRLAGWSLPEAIALISANPARAAGLHDRGELRSGLRADLTLVGVVAGEPQVSACWSAGRLAHRIGFQGIEAWKPELALVASGDRQG